jgi:hypothetical protein
VVKVRENAPVWSLVLLHHRGVLLAALLLKVLDGRLSCLIQLGILAKISLRLQVFHLVFEFALLCSLGVNARDNLYEVLANPVLNFNTHIHIGLFLELHIEHWLLVLVLLLGSFFLLLSLST